MNNIHVPLLYFLYNFCLMILSYEAPIFQDLIPRLFYTVVKYLCCSSGLASWDPYDIRAAGGKDGFH